MNQQPGSDHPLVTDDMRARLGVWGDWGRWSPPIRDSDVRRWALAVYWPQMPPRRFWDEAYARTTRWGGIVAPDEFNPFAWPVRDSSSPPQTYWRPNPKLTRRRVNGGTQARYGVPMRPGDRIRRRVRLADWTTRRSRAGIALLFVDFEHEWRNHDDAFVRESVHTLIYS